MSIIAIRCLGATLATGWLAAGLAYADTPAEPPDVCHPNGHEPRIKKIRYSAASDYPDAAERARQQGRVVLEYSITAKGRVDRVSVIESAGPSLDAHDNDMPTVVVSHNLP